MASLTESRRYLFIDDIPQYLRIYLKILRNAGHSVEIIDNIGAGWTRIECDGPFHLVLIDLGLDRKIREFDREYEEIIDTLRAQGYGSLPISGQVLGLRLWRRRKEMQQRYCYLTNHPQLWLANLNPDDPEFGGEKPEILRDMVLDKSDLWSRNIEEKFQRAHQVWEDEQWLR
uniref:Response regulator receiver domain-containing protein n=1 Tax=Candidatus Kentrum sp. FM TaxID=2126340 RepID=A0A450RXT2_9GAMM|nr:MAG: hypothetical protein BECKFM1743A_GA0114220_100127 [Candidatus Kentron sp. FM]VFJ44258.1 MAG: hypothetical protein BECKFM1743C_GA0114222_1000910 [Candidatus Kentron sp. FM]VFK06155.1 MAG: hypothetical protein BECKFM1743B_GA0114221_1001110 [Candidatus Kentron sp. FM]